MTEDLGLAPTLPAELESAGYVDERPAEPAMRVLPIAWTHFDAALAEDVTGWTYNDPPDRTDLNTLFVDPKASSSGQALAEFAGRACYQSWTKPNPTTATNAGYLKHILEVGHLSVLEHGSVTFYMTGVSRSFTHELVRHRHFSYSQLSQRYVPERDAQMVEPDIIAGDPDLHAKFVAATAAATEAYNDLLTGLEKVIAERDERNPHRPRFAPDEIQMIPSHEGLVRGREICGFCGHRWPCKNAPSATAQKKAARQAARSVLPNATETRIVVTGNYRAWRHFIAMRATEHADVEIRLGAVTCLRALRQIAPNVFYDFRLVKLDDGTWAARTPYRSDSDS